MTNDFLKRTRMQVRNGYGVETRPEYLADVRLMIPERAPECLTIWTSNPKASTARHREKPLTNSRFD